MGLREYQRKRRFERTPEPRGGPAGKGARKRAAKGPSFVVQKHAASRLHYDFRLEHAGVLKSWAVPKGPSLDPGEKRLAVEVEDHPIEYGGFEGIIPQGEYGGGTVLLWDRGRWIPDGDVDAGLRKGHLRFELEGEKLRGAWDLVRTRRGEEEGGKPSWLLIKRDDEAARAGDEAGLLDRRPESVASGRELEAIAAAPERTWSSRRAAGPAKAAKAARPARAAAGARGTRKRARRLPAFRTPQLATLVDAAPEGEAWVHELKLDGYRILAAVAGGEVRLDSRNDKEWTARFPTVAASLAALPVESALLDGEVVALDPQGRSSFQALQAALGEGARADLVYYAFDLLELDGEDLAGLPLLERKRRLAKLLGRRPQGAVRYGDHVAGDGADFFRRACAAGAEGIVSKRADAPYRAGRGRDWLKVKCLARQEMVIGGWTDPAGSRSHLGAILVGVREGGKLRYAGKVGTGFDEATLTDLARRLRPLARKESPFVDPPEGAEGRRAHWVDPKLVAEIAFFEWTVEGKLRHPSFLGLREDKSPREIVREVPAPAPGRVASAKPPAPVKAKAPAKARTKATKARTKAKAASGAAAPVTITHPERVLWPEQGLTKGDLAAYYADVAEWMLPHAKGRLLTLVRCPQGRHRTCFFQKHVGEEAPAGIHAADVRESDGGVEAYHYVEDATGLLALVQLGVLEIHGWGSRFDDIERPDRLVFDLDPGPGVEWAAVVRAAREIRGRLEELGLASWPMTTGGKGLHVVAPLVRRRDWDEVRAFARAFAEAYAREAPDRILSRAAKAERKGRIFLDWMRNGRGASAILPFSTRAREGAPVAATLRWDEIARFRPGALDVRTVRKRLAKLDADPWADYWKARQTLPGGSAVGRKKKGSV